MLMSLPCGRPDGQGWAAEKGTGPVVQRKVTGPLPKAFWSL